MKTSHFLFAMLAAPAVLCSAVSTASAVEAVKDYLPADGSSVKQGAVVRIAHDDSFAELQKAVQERFAKLPTEKQKAIAEKTDPAILMDYNADLWASKADYDKYVAAWKKAKVVPVADVALGLDPVAGRDGVYRILSATRVNGNAMLPITIGALTYDSKTGAWHSNNGDLKAKDFTADDKFAFGAQTGTEWTLENKDALSDLKEVVRFTRTTDGKFMYIYYSLVERSAVTGQQIASHGYLMRFPVKAASASATKPGQK